MTRRRSVIYFYRRNALAAVAAAAAGQVRLEPAIFRLPCLPGVQGCDWWTSHSVAISMYTFEICIRDSPDITLTKFSKGGRC